MMALQPFDGPQGPRAQGAARAKVVEPVEMQSIQRS